MKRSTQDGPPTRAEVLEPPARQNVPGADGGGGEISRSASVKKVSPGAGAKAAATNVANVAGNGTHTNGQVASGELATILACLQTMRDGDFSVRLPGAWVGLSGKI